MSDRRELRFNGHTAHVSLQGRAEAEDFREATPQSVGRPVADLCAAPDGPRDRQLVFGEMFHCLDHRDGWAFGCAGRDGYVGWMHGTALVPARVDPTHMVTAPRSYAREAPGLKARGDVTPLSFGSRVTVLDIADGWAAVDRGDLARWYIPRVHLGPLAAPAGDPVDVAGRFIGTPYLWGGNSSFGIDCSGLVQTACLACGIPCPGDSDQQKATLGVALSDDADMQRGDLVFWTGHVAMVHDRDTLIHANAYHMAVAYEPIAETIARIEHQGDGPVTSRRRIPGLSARISHAI